MNSEHKPWLYMKRTILCAPLGRARTISWQSGHPAAERLAVAKLRRRRRARWA